MSDTNGEQKDEGGRHRVRIDGAWLVDARGICGVGLPELPGRESSGPDGHHATQDVLSNMFHRVFRGQSEQGGNNVEVLSVVFYPGSV